MPQLSTESRVQISNDALFQELQGEAVLLDLNTGVYFGLDRVGTRIWQLLSEHSILSETLAAILQEYDVTKEQCSSDLLSLVQDLQLHGLLTVG